MEKTTRFIAKLGTGVLVVALFAGCNPFDVFKKKETKETEQVEKKVGGSDTVLLNINGKAVLTEADFNKHLDRMLKMNPYFRGAGVESLPQAIKQKFFGELVKQELILAWAEKNNVRNDKKFIEEFEEMKSLVERSLLVQHFESEILKNIEVADGDVQDYFDKNKDKFVKEPGGVAVSGIKFEAAPKATAFYELVKNKKADFVELAKKEDAKNFKDFGRISKDQRAFAPGEIPAAVREKALTLSNLPAVEKITVGKNVWVVYVSDKKDVQYFAMDEIKSQLESMLKQNKFRDVLETEIGKLREQFTVNENKEFFAEKPGVVPQEAGKEVATEAKNDAEPAASTQDVENNTAAAA